MKQQQNTATCGTSLPEVLLKVEDVANILQVSRSFAYTLMQRGEIPTVHIGKSVRVRPTDLDAYINSCVQFANSWRLGL